MEKTIRTLKDLRGKAKEDFIKYSIITHNIIRTDSPVPDTKSYLKDIIELNLAISALENLGMQKTTGSINN